MAKKKPTPRLAPEAAETTSGADDLSVNSAAELPFEPAREDVGEQGYAPDPYTNKTVSLNDERGGPRMRLLRSQRYNQMQIHFDSGHPGEQYLDMLTQMRWKDRTKDEGVWTKQIDRNARWQSVQQMEREFRDVANAIRRDKGLGKVLEGL